MAAAAGALAVAPTGANAAEVMTWNVGSLDRNPDGVVSTIGNQRPDVVGLQEVCVRQSDWIVSEVARRYGVRYHEQPGSVIHRRSACRPWPGSAYGQAILSREPIFSWRNTVWPRLPGDPENRGVLQVTTRIDGQEVRVFNTHLGLWSHCNQWSKVNEIVRMTARHSRAIVMGDFNVAPDQRTERAVCGRRRVMGPLYRRFQEVDPARRPTRNALKIDYIFQRGFRRTGAAVFNTSSSDHRPLLGRIQRR